MHDDERDCEEKATEICHLDERFSESARETLCLGNNHLIPDEDSEALEYTKYEVYVCNEVHECSKLVMVDDCPHTIVYNNPEDSITDTVYETCKTATIVTYNSSKAYITTAPMFDRALVRLVLIMSCPHSNYINITMETVEKTVSKAPIEYESANSRTYKSQATLLIFIKSVYPSDCASTPTTRQPLDISIPPLPQYRRTSSPRQIPTTTRQLTIAPRHTPSTLQLMNTQETPRERSQYKKKEFKINFNKCTVIYKPPQPVYENIKKRIK